MDEADLALAADHWNCAAGDPCYAPAFDLDDNDVIDAFDLAWVGNDYDRTPPVVTIQSPAEGGVVGLGDLLVTGLVTDTHTVVTVTVNNVPAGLTGNEFSATVPLSPMGGNLVLDVVAADVLGAKGLASRVVGVDGDGPMIRIRAPRHRQAVYSMTPSIAISYTDFLTGVNPATLSALVIDETGVATDVTADLAAERDRRVGHVERPVGGRCELYVDRLAGGPAREREQRQQHLLRPAERGRDHAARRTVRGRMGQRRGL